MLEAFNDELRRFIRADDGEIFDCRARGGDGVEGAVRTVASRAVRRVCSWRSPREERRTTGGAAQAALQARSSLREGYAPCSEESVRCGLVEEVKIGASGLGKLSPCVRCGVADSKAGQVHQNRAANRGWRCRGPVFCIVIILSGGVAAGGGGVRT